MNIDRKKIIAKEVIYLFTLVLCIVITWGVVELRNKYLHNKQDEIAHNITTNNSKLDSLNQHALPEVHRKQLVFNLTKMFEQGATDEEGRKYMKDFRAKFEDKTILEQIKLLSKSQIQLEKDKQAIQTSFIDNNLSDGFTRICAIILLSILYPVRLTYILIRWSFRTLRKNK